MGWQAECHCMPWKGTRTCSWRRRRRWTIRMPPCGYPARSKLSSSRLNTNSSSWMDLSPNREQTQIGVTSSCTHRRGTGCRWTATPEAATGFRVLSATWTRGTGTYGYWAWGFVLRKDSTVGRCGPCVQGHIVLTVPSMCHGATLTPMF